MVLLISLALITLMTMLLFTLLQGLLLYYKAYGALMSQHQSFYQLEKVAEKIMEKEAIPQPACIFSAMDARKMKAHLMAKEGCNWQVLKQNYRYGWLDKGKKTCVQVQKGNVFLPTHHWFLMVINPSSEDGLMLRLAKPMPGSGKLCPQSRRRIIFPGIISWYRLIEEDK